MEKTIYKYGVSLRKACVMLLLLMVALASCDRRELEVMEPQKTSFRIEVRWASVDWDSYYGGKPSGMTVMLFGAKNPDKPIVELTNAVDYVNLDLDPDKYRMVIFNNSAGEFGSMNFENMNDYDNMVARAVKFTPMQATEWTAQTVFHRDPERIGVVLEEFEITEDMLLSQVTFYPYKAWLRALRADTRFYQRDDLTYVIEVTPVPVTSTLFLRVHVQGLVNMRSVEGSISGMADGYYLTREQNTSETALHLLDSWSVRSDENFNGNGWITTTIPVWGEPFGMENADTRPADHHQLKLHFNLRDGKTQCDFSFNVGRELRYMRQNAAGEWEYTDEKTRYMVLTIWNFDLGEEPGEPEDPGDDPGKEDPDPDDPHRPHDPILPFVESDGQGSGFDAVVMDWEDGGTFDIGF